MSMNMMKEKSREKENGRRKDEVMCNKQKLHSNYQKRAEEAEAVLEELVGLVGTIINASNKELKSSAASAKL